jgi:hypothetical protein
VTIAQRAVGEAFNEYLLNRNLRSASDNQSAWGMLTQVILRVRTPLPGPIRSNTWFSLPMVPNIFMTPTWPVRSWIEPHRFCSLLPGRLASWRRSGADAAESTSLVCRKHPECPGARS